MPLFHISGFSILVRSLLYGNKVQLYENFDADAIAQNIIEGAATYMSVVAVTLERILHALEQRNALASPQFKMLLAGGGPVPKDYLTRASALNLAVAQTYGMTETSSQTATLASEDAMQKKLVQQGSHYFSIKLKSQSQMHKGKGKFVFVVHM